MRCRTSPGRGGRSGSCPRAATFLAGWGLPAIYLSLFPFHFPLPPGGPEPDAVTIAAQATRAGPPIDFIVNVLPFAAIGLVGRVVTRGARAPRTIAWIVFRSGALALPLQIARVFLPARFPRLWDVAANMAGTVGGLAARRIMDRIAAAPPSDSRPFQAHR